MHNVFSFHSVLYFNNIVIAFTWKMKITDHFGNVASSESEMFRNIGKSIDSLPSRLSPSR